MAAEFGKVGLGMATDERLPVMLLQIFQLLSLQFWRPLEWLERDKNFPTSLPAHT